MIVNTTSVSGIVGNPWNAAYAASKGGVLMLTKALAAEYRHRGVRVNGMAPGMVATDLSAGFTDFFTREDIDLSGVRTRPAGAGGDARRDRGDVRVRQRPTTPRTCPGAIIVLDGGATA